MRKMLYKSLLSLFGALLLGTTLAAQDPVFSQFYTAPLYTNPALAGVSFGPRLNLNYRNQYPGWPNAYTTIAATVDAPLEQLNSGIGLTIVSDEQGDGVYRNNYFNATYAYHARFDNGIAIRLGLNAGAIQTAVDGSRLVFSDVIDPIDGPGDLTATEEQVANLTRTSVDVGAGFLVSAGPAYAGISLAHLNSPDESLLIVNDNLSVGRPLRTSVQAGAQIELSSYNNRRQPTFISPNLIYVRQGGFQQLNVGAYAGFGRFFGGTWYRHAFGNADAVIATAGFREGVLRVGYSYDLTLSSLAGVPGGLGGTHEISLGIDLGNSRELRNRRYQDRWNDCYGLFR
jgi:type IX secretion system PorP/SprF family membrane protein